MARETGIQVGAVTVLANTMEDRKTLVSLILGARLRSEAKRIQSALIARFGVETLSRIFPGITVESIYTLPTIGLEPQSVQVVPGWVVPILATLVVIIVILFLVLVGPTVYSFFRTVWTPTTN